MQAEQAMGKKNIFGGTPKWSSIKIKGLIGVSGVYNCADLRQHFNQRGLYFSLFDRIMSFQGKTQLKALSPTYVVHGAQYASLMPPVLLLHGTKDTCAPLANAQQFDQALQRAGIQVMFMKQSPLLAASSLSPANGSKVCSEFSCCSILLLSKTAVLMSMIKGRMTEMLLYWSLFALSTGFSDSTQLQSFVLKSSQMVASKQEQPLSIIAHACCSQY